MAIPSSELRWTGATPEQLTFMKAVYEKCVINGAKQRNFVADLPATDTAVVESKKVLASAAASKCIELLKAIRDTASAEQKNCTIAIGNSYRSATKQLSLWQDNFVKYYKETASTRTGKPGGEHGEAAATHLANYTGQRIAAPGFSNHQNGLAVDFDVVENGTTHTALSNKESTTSWRDTWFWTWMEAHAKDHGFFQNTAINEPWHWEYRGAVGKTPKKSAATSSTSLTTPKKTTTTSASTSITHSHNK